MFKLKKKLFRLKLMKSLKHSWHLPTFIYITDMKKNQFKFIILFYFYSWLFCYIFKFFKRNVVILSIWLNIKYQWHIFFHLPPRDTSITQSLRHICCGDGIVMLLNQEKYLYPYLNDAPKLRKRIDWKNK